MDWLEITLAKLAAAPRSLTLARIAQETGLSVSWLSDFQGGKIADPGIRKVQVLHDFLTPPATPKRKRV